MLLWCVILPCFSFGKLVFLKMCCINKELWIGTQQGANLAVILVSK